MLTAIFCYQNHTILFLVGMDAPDLFFWNTVFIVANAVAIEGRKFCGISIQGKYPCIFSMT